MLTPLVIACALFMENLDGTVISTSLPAIAADLHQDPITLKLALTSYLLSLAVFIPASGWAADRFGSRTIFRGAIVVFTLGSILCGLSSTLPGFIGARVIPGLGGAMMVPVGRLVLVRSVPRDELVTAMAYLTIPALIGPILGPPLGGFITTFFAWRWIFWINVPIGILGFVLATLFIADVRESEVWPLDIRGFILSGMGLSLATFGLTVAGRGFVSPPVALAMLIAGFTLIGLYVRHARRTPYPILDLKLLSLPTFRASLFGGFMFRLGIGSLPFLLPLMLQIGFGLTPFQSGCVTFASAAGAMAMKTTAKPILQRFGFKSVLVVNAIVSSLFLLIYAAFTSSTPWSIIFASLLFGGFFRSLEFTAINALAFADIDARDMSRATSFTSVSQQLSLSTGVATGAGAIEISQWLHQDAALGSGDFSLAFITVAILCATSTLIFVRLPAGAGDTLRQITREAAAGALTSTGGMDDQPASVLDVAVPRNPVART